MTYQWDYGESSSPGGQTELIHRLRHQVGRIMDRARPLSPAPPVEEPVQKPEEFLPPPTHLEATVDEEGLVYRHLSPPGHRLGDTALEPPGPELLAQVAALLELERGHDPDQCSSLSPGDFLFLDIETTGLGGRGENEEPLGDGEQGDAERGPMAFTIGLGTWADDPGGHFKVDQIFLQDPEREAEALELLCRYVDRCQVLVTFNGRAFDWPVLLDRAALHGVPLALAGRRHMDLLAPSRRLFRPRLQDCRQQTLERSMLGFSRSHDVAGAEAPVIYWSFLRTGRWDAVTGVLEHNRLDVTCMAPLLLLLARHVADPLHWAEDSEELLAAGVMHLRVGNKPLGRRCLERGLEMARVSATRRLLLAALAREQRRAGEADRACELWQRYAEDFPQYNTGWIELAKYHEHVSRDLAAAEIMALRAPRQTEDVRHRLNRLRRRLERQED